jgi:lysophospholipase L1-like esterase
MAGYPLRGLTPWDTPLKAYIDDRVDASEAGSTTDLGVADKVENGPLTQAALSATIDDRADDRIATLGGSLFVTRDESAPLIRNPEGLRRWRVAFGDALLGVVKQPTVSFIGDSITKGAFSNNLSNAASTQFDTFRARGYVTQFRRRLAGQYGAPGDGFIACVTTALDATAYENQVTISASSNSGTIGPQKSGRAITSGQTITLTTVNPCTKVGIMAWWAAGTSAPFTYTVDGGSSVTGPTKSGSDTSYVHWITGLANTTHTIVISGPATLRADIGGFLAETGVGVRVHNIGWGGHTIVSASANDLSASSQARVLNGTLALTETDLAVVMFRHNDGATGVTKATFKDGVQDIVDYQAARGGCTLLLPDPAGDVAWDLAQYADAMREVSDATDHCAFMDFDDLWGGFAAANALGMYQDGIHPKSVGHGDMARVFEKVLTAANLGVV